MLPFTAVRFIFLPSYAHAVTLRTATACHVVTVTATSLTTALPHCSARWFTHRLPCPAPVIRVRTGGIRICYDAPHLPVTDVLDRLYTTTRSSPTFLTALPTTYYHIPAWPSTPIPTLPFFPFACLLALATAAATAYPPAAATSNLPTHAPGADDRAQPPATRYASFTFVTHATTYRACRPPPRYRVGYRSITC